MTVGPVRLLTNRSRSKLKAAGPVYVSGYTTIMPTRCTSHGISVGEHIEYFRAYRTFYRAGQLDEAAISALIVKEMEDTLVDVRSDAARLIADRKEIRRRLGRLVEAQGEWQRRAELAVQNTARTWRLRRIGSRGLLRATDSIRKTRRRSWRPCRSWISRRRSTGFESAWTRSFRRAGSRSTRRLMASTPATIGRHRCATC
mgnify:CR=1 FL=1